MFSTENSILDFQSLDALEYVNIEPDFLQDSQTSLLNQEIRRQNMIHLSKLKYKAALSILRVFCIILFYFIDAKPLSTFLYSMISFLFVHEIIVLMNFFISYSSLILSRLFSIRAGPVSNNIPKVSYFLDMIANFLFFAWFIFGNVCILTNKEDVDSSLQKNKVLTYYIIMLVLLGYFIYSRLIFYAVFFIAFCPCIMYVVMFEKSQTQIKEEKLQKKMKEETYKDYCERNSLKLDECCICGGDFNEKDTVIQLPCSNVHCYHSQCIKKWVEKKTVCPLCRVNLISSQNENGAQTHLRELRNEEEEAHLNNSEGNFSNRNQWQ